MKIKALSLINIAAIIGIVLILTATVSMFFTTVAMPQNSKIK